MRAMQTALQTGFGIDGSIEDIDYSGRTDPWIMRQIFSKYGLPATEDNFKRYRDAYVAELPAEMAASARVRLASVLAIPTSSHMMRPSSR